MAQLFSKILIRSKKQAILFYQQKKWVGFISRCYIKNQINFYLILMKYLRNQQIQNMNKFSSQGKSKLKTLPNQIGTHQQQFLFQSQCDDEYIKKLNIASPTFATHELGSTQQNIHQKTMRVSQANKENRISLSLKQYKNDDNSGPACKQNSLEFLKGQNQKLVQKCTNLNNQNKQLIQENRILKQKLIVSKKRLEQKAQVFQKRMEKYVKLPNSSPDLDNIDIYLQLQVFKSDLKTYKQSSEKLESENLVLRQKIRQLQLIIQNYTQKSEKKKAQKDETIQKTAKLQKMYTQKLEQIKKKSQIKIKQYQADKIQKQKLIKKSKDQYQKLKFLKEQIEKKRQQQLRCRQQTQKQLKQKQQKIASLKQQTTKYQQQCKTAYAKLASYSQNSQNIEQQLIKSHQQLQGLKLSFSALEAQNGKWKHSLQNYKLVNEKYSQEITSLRKQNQQFYQNIQTLKLQKDRLQCINQKHISNQQRLTKKITELQSKTTQTQKQIQEIRMQFDQLISKNSTISNNTQRSYHPNISKFQQQQHSQKQITSRASERERKDSNHDKMRKIQQQFNGIIQGLHKQIQGLRKQKQSLQSDLMSQRQKYEKINLQLQNTYRKIQEYNSPQFDRDGRDRNIYLKKGETYGSSLIPFELARTTKAVPQLKMIKQILRQILGISQNEQAIYKNSANIFRQKDREYPNSLQDLICEIKNLSEDTADFFDERTKQLQDLDRRIKHKEQVISKLLRFTPQQKKACILEYLKVMEAYQEYPIQQVYKVTKVLQEQANQWKRNVNYLIESVQKSEEQVIQLKKQINKYKSEGAPRRIEPSINDRFDKYEKQRNSRHEQKWQYQRKRY